MRPIVHGLEAEYWGEIDFVYLDIDDAHNKKVEKDYRFTSTPLFILIAANGTEVKRLYGYWSAKDLREVFDSYLTSVSG
jgi:thioredoxin-like negative regulator of GroEL